MKTADASQDFIDECGSCRGTIEPRSDPHARDGREPVGRKRVQQCSRSRSPKVEDDPGRPACVRAARGGKNRQEWTAGCEAGPVPYRGGKTEATAASVDD
ncbi:hypothetical protein CMUS01_01064 [Colletotrichum musicola]|uniref:Uncharacterized protein n=1 Tax=Colletotrichum musicola TaxID=2175873 RepID=A0A8H6NXQ1_9PEZI|nr:hypothetical protein CMUS01_01064 [Colletotrichum musicola]